MQQQDDALKTTTAIEKLSIAQTNQIMLIVYTLSPTANFMNM
jgi:hypothetical protein